MSGSYIEKESERILKNEARKAKALDYSQRAHVFTAIHGPRPSFTYALMTSIASAMGEAYTEPSPFTYEVAMDLLRTRERYAPLTLDELSRYQSNLFVGRNILLREKEACVVLSGGTLAYLADPSDITRRTEKALKAYEEARNSSPKISSFSILVTPACALYAELLRIHPFSLGNIPLANLVLAYALWRDGFPLMISVHANEAWSRIVEDVLKGGGDTKALEEHVTLTCENALRGFSNVLRV